MNFTQFIPKYILTVELTELCQSYFQSPIGLDIVKEFSFARIFLFISNSIATFFIVVALQSCSIHSWMNRKQLCTKPQMHKRCSNSYYACFSMFVMMVVKYVFYILQNPQCTNSQKAKSSWTKNRILTFSFLETR